MPRNASSTRRATPLDPQRLRVLAVEYAARYATTRAKMARYLTRKVAERGWSEAEPPQIDAIVNDCAERGYVNDTLFAEAHAAALTRRGYGIARIRQKLRGDGVADETVSDSLEGLDARAIDAALVFARRRKLGPFAFGAPAEATFDPKLIAAFLRAGHSYEIARRVLAMPSDEPDPDFI